MKPYPAINCRRQSGMALMLVLPAVALAAILAYAVLANTGSQEQISANSASIAQADLLAESGVNYALYNLQNPTYAPTYTGSFWSGPSGTISIGSGTFNVSLTQSGSNFIITSTGTLIGPTGTTVTRQISTIVQLVYQAVQPNQALGIVGNVTLGMNQTITGNPIITGTFNSSPGSIVNGNVEAASLVNSGGTITGSFEQTPTSGLTVAPNVVTDYRTYIFNGVTYSAKLLTGDPAAGTVLGPTSTNPAGIYYAQGRNMNLNGVTVNGTLIVKKIGATGGGVVVTGTAANTITPMTGFPGLLVDTTISVSGASRQLTVNGLVWAAGGVTGTAATNSSNITVNGSLLIPNSQGFGNYTGGLNLNYNAQNVAVANFSSQSQVPKNVTVVDWSEQ